MGRRFFVIALVFVFAGALAYIQNTFFVGSQELFAVIREQGEQRYEVVLKDLAGNVVDASLADVAELDKRLGASASKKAVPHHDLVLTDDKTITFAVERQTDLRELRQHIVQVPFERANPARDWLHLNLGIDLRGGVEFNCSLYDEAGLRVPATDDVVGILRDRLDARGLSEPQVVRLANGDVQVVIPGGTKADAARTRKVLETTGKLEFRELIGDYPAGALIEKKGNRYVFSDEARSQGIRRQSRDEVVMPEKPPRGEVPTRFYHLGPIKLTGNDVQDAFRTMQDGQTVVGINFTVTGGAKNHRFTTGVKQKGDEGRGTGRIAISLDGFVESAPVIRSPSSNSCIIEGNFTDEEVNSLRTVLKAGSLAVKPEVVSQRVVGPTLGHDTIIAGVNAMASALALVLLFILGWYWWRLGTVAVASLATCLILIVAAVSAFGATLTLPGLAGLVLTVGMAVDANILIFERIREEIGEDVDVATCIHAGYSRAFLTIFDANITTFLTAFVLYMIGSGPVKGFGLMLMIGILTSMFGALYVGRALTDYFYRRQGVISIPSRIRVPLINFLGMRFVSILMSLLLIAGSLAWFGFGGKMSRNFDIDFTGGNMTQVTFATPLTLDQAQQAIATTHESDPDRYDLLNPDDMQIQPYYAGFADAGGGARQFVFKVRDEGASAIEARKAAMEAQKQPLQQELRRFQTDDSPSARAEIKRLSDEIAQINERIQPVKEELAQRVEDFKQQLAEAFPGKIGDEGDELIEATWADQTLTIALATLTPVENSVATQLRIELNGKTYYDDAEVTPLSDPQGIRVALHLHEDALELAEVINEGPIAAQAQRLLTEAGAPADLLPVLTQRAKELAVLVDSGIAANGVQVAAAFPASDYFSPQVAEQMKWRALGAIGLSIVIIMIYIAMRFELRFGVSAILALLHDLLATIGLLAVFGVRIDLTVIAGLLTIVGYSLNDTIVVFDRIREIMKNSDGKVREAIDPAIRQTMSRTLLTSATTLFSVLLLFLFGGDGVNSFSATMLIGLVLGTYSSIFIAAPALLLFKDREPESDDEAHEGELIPADS